MHFLMCTFFNTIYMRFGFFTKFTSGSLFQNPGGFNSQTYFFKIYFLSAILLLAYTLSFKYQTCK